MPDSRKIGRVFVRNRPTRVLTAMVDCMVVIWCSHYVDANDGPATEVYFEVDKKLCSLNEGVPLPQALRVDVRLEAGETLWAITEDMGLMGYSVVEQYLGDVR